MRIIQAGREEMEQGWESSWIIKMAIFDFGKGLRRIKP